MHYVCKPFYTTLDVDISAIDRQCYRLGQRTNASACALLSNYASNDDRETIVSTSALFCGGHLDAILSQWLSKRWTLWGMRSRLPILNAQCLRRA